VRLQPDCARLPSPVSRPALRGRRRTAIAARGTTPSEEPALRLEQFPPRDEPVILPLHLLVERAVPNVEHAAGMFGEQRQEVSEQLPPVAVVLADPAEEPVAVLRAGRLGTVDRVVVEPLTVSRLREARVDAAEVEEPLLGGLVEQHERGPRRGPREEDRPPSRALRV